jgi:hypothetical protein
LNRRMETILEITNLDRNAATRVDLDTADGELHEERLRCMRAITELQQGTADVSEELLSPTSTQGRPPPDGGNKAGLVVKALPLSPNPRMDTDGRREDSGRGVRELQAR